MSTWLQSHQSLRDHPKKDRLSELLFNGSVPDDVSDLAAIGLLHRFWWWALDYAQDGDLTKFSDRQIAKGCGWRGDSRLFVESLAAAGFIDDEPRRIHDWDEYAGKLVKWRQRERERVRDWREKSSVPVPNAYRTRVVQGRESRVKKELNSKRPVDNSTIRPLPVDNSQRTCWRCGLAITGDEMLDDKCVLSRKGLRHAECLA